MEHHEPRELGIGTVRGDSQNTVSLGNRAEGSPEEVLGLGHHEPRELENGEQDKRAQGEYEGHGQLATIS